MFLFVQPCPCYGYKTYIEKPSGTYNICTVCYWEDDQSQLDDIDHVSGANNVSLRQTQKNFREFGACEEDMIKNVQSPSNDEMRDDNWKWID